MKSLSSPSKAKWLKGSDILEELLVFNPSMCVGIQGMQEYYLLLRRSMPEDTIHIELHAQAENGNPLIVHNNRFFGLAGSTLSITVSLM